MSNDLFIVHRNGTSRVDLLAQHQNVLKSCRSLADNLARAAPNARDYYVAKDGDERFAKAQKEYLAMKRKLQDITRWAEEGALNAYEQEQAN